MALSPKEKLEAVIEAALLAGYDHLHPYDQDSPRRTAFLQAGIEAANNTLTLVTELV